ncbi:MAG TPA: DMT family transporter [Candidatus Acidoferrum sp.]|nr:DMT family transporter [Candidatus Acidoferrum sp.]
MLGSRAFGSISRTDRLRLILAAASWGTGTAVSKHAVNEIPPLLLLAIQLTSSLVLLAIVMRAAGLPLRGSPPTLARLGVLNPGIAYALGLAGLTYITASLSVLLWAVEPIFILLAAALVLGESIGAGIIGLSVVAAGGMGLVVLGPGIGGDWPGIVLTLVGVGFCAAYTVIARRSVAGADSTAQVVLAQQGNALAIVIPVLAVAFAAGGLGPIAPSPGGLLSAIASGILYYSAAYWFYLGALRSVPASIAAASFYLIPVFGLAASALLLGERLQTYQWLGVGVVVIAVALIVRPQAGVRRASPEPA